MAHGAALIFDLIAKDGASPAFLKVAGAADKAAGATMRSAKSMETASARMAAVGAKLTKTLTLPIAGAVAVSIEQASKYQKGLATIANATDQTNRQMQTASKGLLTIAKSTGTGLDQLTEGLYTVEKGGLRGAKALDTVRAAAQGAKAENADMGTVTNALTSIMASYGKQIGTPVQAMSELVRGSGLAKTSLQTFAGSLSTVVPLAAKAGIKFNEVAGAIDTLTQHGTSAQEATQELANLIRNLQAPSQVAQKAMQQIGLSVTNVTSKLGKRGLIGTLNLVENAVSKHLGRAGLVTVDTFKKSAAATADLNTMIGSMPAGLAKYSKGLLDGSVNIKNYQQASKALGGTAGAQGLQFLSLYKSSKGFNDLLKSGQPAQRTAAAQLKDMLGGSTALNAALQLGGHSAKYFADSSKSIADAAKNAGADVLGWSRTQGLFSTKVDQAKESLQVMAVEIGTAVMPAVTKIVDMVTRAVHWFDNLSSGQKKVLAWSAGILAALGPILSIGAKLATVGRAFGTFAATAGSKLALLGGSSETTAARVGTAMRRVTGAVSGVLAGGLAAQVGGNSSGGWLSSIFLGAGGGWALGGPVGAAVGGVSAAIFKGIGLWNDHKEAASKAAAAEKAWVQQLTSAIDQDNGAIGSHLKLLVTQQLTDSGALAKAKKLGLNLGDVIGAAMGDAVGKKAFGADIGSHIDTLQQQLSARMAKLTAEKNKFLAANPGHAVPRNIGLELAGDTGTVKAINAQIAAYKAYRDAIDKTAGDTRKAAATEKLKLTALNAGRTATGEYTKQLQAFTSGASRAVDGNNTLSASLAKGSVIGDHNRQTLAALAASAKQQAIQVGASAAQHHNLAAGVTAANRALAQDKTAIEKAAVAAGFSKGAVDKMLGSLGKLGAKDVKPQIGVNDQATRKARAIQAQINAIRQNRVPGLRASTTAAENAIRRLQAEIDALHGKTIINQVFTKTNMLGSQPGNPHSRNNGPNAAGTTALRDGYFTVGESTNARSWELGYKTGSKVQIWSNAESRKKTGWNNVPGFASGTRSTPVGAGVVDRAQNNMVAAELAAAARTIAQAIGNAVKPAITSISGLTHAFAGSRSSATSAQFKANVAGQQYAVLAKRAASLTSSLTNLRLADKKAVDVARNHAVALFNQAHAAMRAAENMPAKTKAEKAARDAAEKHAKKMADNARLASQAATKFSRSDALTVAGLQKIASAASAAASKAKDAYGTLSSAAKDAASKAADAAKALVDAVQSKFDTLQSTITDFTSSITQGLTQGTGLSDVWGQVLQNQTDATDALTTANQNLADAQSAVADAQQAITDAAPDLSALSAAQNAVAQLTGQWTAAHAALLAAQSAVAAGSGSAQQYAALTAAQQRQTDIVTALSAANSDLASAQDAVTNATGPTQDQITALTTAQQNLATATTAASDAAAKAAANTGSYANLKAQFDSVLAATQGFSGDLNKLVADGANQDLITQIVGMGTTAGDQLAQQLLAAGPDGVKALQASMSSIASVAGNEGNSLAGVFYSAGENSMKQLIAGIEKSYPALKAALDPIIAQIQGLLGGQGTAAAKTGNTKSITLSGKYTIGSVLNNYPETLAQLIADNPKLKGKGINDVLGKGYRLDVPSFARGITNFGGGLAYVHRNEALVNLPPRTDVVASRNTGKLVDLTPVVNELKQLNTRMARLEGHAEAAPERTGDAVGGAVLVGIGANNQAKATQGMRDYRTQRNRRAVSP